MSFRAVRPAPGEFAPFYASYVARVPDGDVLETLVRQGAETAVRLGRLEARQELHRYAPDKWSVRQVVGHLSDAERVFAYRMLRFSRGDATPLPGFDENLYAAAAPHERTGLVELLGELAALRRSTVALLAQLDEAAWGRQGEANGRLVSVRALAWIVAGHELHHLAVLAERYGLGAASQA